jgi:hypothetical protein
VLLIESTGVRVGRGDRELRVGLERAHGVEQEDAGANRHAVVGRGAELVGALAGIGVDQQHAEPAVGIDVQPKRCLVDPACRALIQAELAEAAAAVAAAQPDVEPVGAVLVVAKRGKAGRAAMVAADHAAAQEPQGAEQHRAAAAKALHALGCLDPALAGQTVGDAVALGRGRERLAVVEARLVELLALEAGLVGVFRQPRAQEARADIVALGDQLLAAEQVGDLELELAGTDQRRQVLDRERPGRHLLGDPPGIVQEDLGDRGLVGQAADGRQREGDEGRVGREIGRPLDTAKAHRPAERAALGQAVAQAKAGAVVRKISGVGGVEAHEGALGIGDVAGPKIANQHADLIEQPELEQGIQPGAQLVTGQEQEIVVEKAAPTGDRRERGRPSRLQRARLERVGRQVQLDRQARGVVALLEARQRIERIERLAVEGDDPVLVEAHAPDPQIEHLDRPLVRAVADEQGAVAHQLAVQDHGQQPFAPLALLEQRRLDRIAPADRTGLGHHDARGRRRLDKG